MTDLSKTFLLFKCAKDWPNIEHVALDILCHMALLVWVRGLSRAKKSWIPVCPLDKQLTNFACPGKSKVKILYLFDRWLVWALDEKFPASPVGKKSYLSWVKGQALSSNPVKQGLFWKFGLTLTWHHSAHNIFLIYFLISLTSSIHSTLIRVFQ